MFRICVCLIYSFFLITVGYAASILYLNNIKFSNFKFDVIKKFTKSRLLYLLISVIFSILIISVFHLVYGKDISGNDFWWHIKVGEWICKNHCIPKEAIFSWYGISNNLPWTAHEWLSEVIFFYNLQIFWNNRHIFNVI